MSFDIDDQRIVFVTGLGRSGTVFVSQLLKSDSTCLVRHEFLAKRNHWLLSWYLGDAYCKTHLEQHLPRLRNSLASNKKVVEVNPYMQHFTPTILREFPRSQIFHLVRDGREVVRSIYARRMNRLGVLPKDEKGLTWWSTADRFSQICWNWNNTTRHLLDLNHAVLRLEDITADFKACRDSLLTPAGIDVDEETWAALRERKVNRTRSRLYRRLYAHWRGAEPVTETLPRYDAWSAEQKETFDALCGDSMRRLGYF